MQQSGMNKTGKIMRGEGGFLEIPESAPPLRSSPLLRLIGCFPSAAAAGGLQGGATGGLQMAMIYRAASNEQCSTCVASVRPSLPPAGAVGGALDRGWERGGQSSVMSIDGRPMNPSADNCKANNKSVCNLQRNMTNV